MNSIRKSFTLFLTCCLLVSTWFSVSAQAQNPRYFPETGHNLQGDFFNFYYAVSDPTTLYGYPITEEFTRADGLKVQYFQRTRFEYHPELPEGQRVTLTNIGTELYTPGTQLNIYSPFACRLFTPNNYAVCFAFLEFLDKNGGVAQFGNPISPFEYHDGVIVQYFEKARMEWQPSNPENQRVVLTDIGRLYFDKLHEDPGLLQAVQPVGGIAPIVTSIQVRAFAWKAVTLANDQQLIFIIAQDQNGLAVNQATCTANVRWPSNTIETQLSMTNSNGVAIIPLNVINQPYGNLVYIDITCTANNQSGTSSTSFRIWY